MTMITRTMRVFGAMGLVGLLAGCVAPTPYGAAVPVQPAYTEAAPVPAPAPYYGAPAPYYGAAPVYPAYPAYYDPYPYGVAAVGISVIGGGYYGSRYYDDDYYYRSGKNRKRSSKYKKRDRRGSGVAARNARRGDYDALRGGNSASDRPRPSSKRTTSKRSSKRGSARGVEEANNKPRRSRLRRPK